MADHRHDRCPDETCPRLACRAYREGYQDGYAEGVAAGWSAGFAAGQAAATVTE